MIASIRGVVVGRTGGAAIVEVGSPAGGLGYLVNASSRTLESLGDRGSEVSLVVVTQVREDAITLYGFRDDEERDVFQMLVSVQGVGPKVALAMLSAFTPTDLIRAIVAGDVREVRAADGVGPKLAQRIVSELADKAAAALPAMVGAPTVARQPGPGRPAAMDGEDDARTGLLTLGYGKAEVEQLLAGVRAQPDAPSGAAAIISSCLRMAGSRLA